MKILCGVLCLLILAGCSSAGLVGTWEGDGDTLTFRSDGTCQLQFGDGIQGGGRYTYTKDELTITADSRLVFHFAYRIRGGTLTLTLGNTDIILQRVNGK